MQVTEDTQEYQEVDVYFKMRPCRIIGEEKARKLRKDKPPYEYSLCMMRCMERVFNMSDEEQVSSGAAPTTFIYNQLVFIYNDLLVRYNRWNDKENDVLTC